MADIPVTTLEIPLIKRGKKNYLVFELHTPAYTEGVTLYGEVSVDLDHLGWQLRRAQSTRSQRSQMGGVVVKHTRTEEEPQGQ